MVSAAGVASRHEDKLDLELAIDTPYRSLASAITLAEGNERLQADMKTRLQLFKKELDAPAK